MSIRPHAITEYGAHYNRNENILPIINRTFTPSTEHALALPPDSYLCPVVCPFLFASPASSSPPTAPANSSWDLCSPPLHPSRKAVQSYLAPPENVKRNGASPSTPRSNDKEPSPRRQAQSPHRATRSQWCSPVRPESEGVCRGDVPPLSPVAAAKQKGGWAGASPPSPPPLLLSPTEWGAGLSGEWVSLHGPRPNRGAGNRVSSKLLIALW